MPRAYSESEVYNIIRRMLIKDYEGYDGPYGTATFWEEFFDAHTKKFHVLRSEGLLQGLSMS